MGKDINFIPILNLLKEIHIEYPDLRFGQVLQSALDKSKYTKNTDLHNYSTKNILLCLREFKRYTEQLRKAKSIKEILKVKIDKVPDSHTDSTIKLYRSKLIKIQGIGNKTADDIMNIYNTEEDLIASVYGDKPLAVRDDIEKLLKEVFKK